MRSWRMLATGLFLSIGLAAVSPATSLFDDDVHFPQNYYTMQPPPVGGSYVDPAFGTTVTRLTDGTGLGYGGYVPEYSQHSAFNLDDSYLVLLRGTSVMSLHEGDGDFIRVLDEIPGVSAEARWSRLNPNWIYFHNGSRVKRLDVSSGQVANIGPSFSGGISFGRGQGDISDNERIVIIRGGRYVSIFDLTTGSQISELDTRQSPINGRSFDNATVSADGNRFIIGFNSRGSGRGTGVELFDADGTFMGQLLNTQGHAAMGRDVDGAQVLYMTNPATLPVQPAGCYNGIVKIHLDGSSRRDCLLTMDWIISKHLSANGNDGWVYISTYNEDARPEIGGPADPTKWYTYTNEIFRVRADGSVVERLAHHRSSIDSYWLQPHASIGISGKRIVWGADFWLNEQSEYGDAYMIRVDGGGGGPSTPTPPATPTTLQAAGFTDPRVDLTWTDNADDEDSYEVLRRAPGDSSYRFLAILGADANSYQDQAVTHAAEYCYRVVAHGPGVASEPSNAACATPAAPQPPAAPTSLSTTGYEQPRVELSWRDNSADEDAFAVLRRGPQESQFTEVSMESANATSFTDMNVTSGQQFCYEVKSMNEQGSSAPSGVSCATPPMRQPDPEPDPEPDPAPEPDVPTPPAPPAGESTLPAAPTDLEAYWGYRRIDLSWADNADNESRYRVYRRVGRGEYELLTDVDADTTSIRDTGARWWWVRHCYRVFAENDAGQAVSNEACAVFRRRR